MNNFGIILEKARKYAKTNDITINEREYSLEYLYKGNYLISSRKDERAIRDTLIIISHTVETVRLIEESRLPPFNQAEFTELYTID